MPKAQFHEVRHDVFQELHSSSIAGKESEKIVGKHRVYSDAKIWQRYDCYKSVEAIQTNGPQLLPL